MLRAYHRVDQRAIYSFSKRGVFYYSRRVPKALQSEFGKERVVVCLHTRSAAQAQKLASALSLKLEAIWGMMRVERLGIVTCGNPFSGTFIPEVGQRIVRKPVPDGALLSIQRSCTRD